MQNIDVLTLVLGILLAVLDQMEIRDASLLDKVVNEQKLINILLHLICVLHLNQASGLVRVELYMLSTQNFVLA